MSYFSFHRNIQLRLVLQFITNFAMSSVIPFLAVFFAGQVGELWTGLMYVGVILTGVVGALLGGRKADQCGRKNIILLCEIMIAIGYGVAGLSNIIFSVPIFITFLLFVVITFFSGMVVPAYSAVIIDSTTKENRKAVYTVSYWLNNLAVALGGITGALLFKSYSYQLFLGIAAITFISWLVTKKWLKESYQPTFNQQAADKQLSKSGQNNYKEIFKNKQFMLFACAGLLLISLEESLTTYMGIKMVHDIQTPVSLFPSYTFITVDGYKMLGILKAENTILVVILTILVASVFKRYSDRLLMLGGSFCYALGYIVISYSSVPIVLILAIFISTFGELAFIPSKQAYVASLVPDDKRGSYMAVYGLSFQFSAVLASVFVMISNFLSSGYITMLFILMAITSLFIYSSLLKSDKVKVVQTPA